MASGRDQGSGRRRSDNETYYDDYPQYYEGRHEIEGSSTIGTPEDYGSGESGSGGGRVQRSKR